MKRIIILLVTSIVGLKVHSQDFYEKNYCIPSLTFSNKAIISIDSSLLITGQSRSNSDQMGDVLLLSIDKSGIQDYMHEFGGQGFDEGYSIIQDNSRNIYVVGSIVVGDTVVGDIGLELTDIYLIKTNKDGKILWEKTYNVTPDDKGLTLIDYLQDTLILIGLTGLNEQNILFLKIDTVGNIKQKREFEVENIQGSISLIKTINNNFLLGYTGDYDVNLKLLDSQGNEIWTKCYGSQFGQKSCNSIQQTADSGYIIVGNTDALGFGNSEGFNTNDNIYLLKLDKDFNISWEKAYGFDKEECGLDVLQTKDNGFIICGEKVWDYGKPSFSIFLKTSASGDSLWLKQYGKDYKSYLSTVLKINDGFYGIGGIFINNDWDVFVVKTDSIGNIDTSYLPTNIDHLTAKQEIIRTFPNPASDKLYYQIQNSFMDCLFKIYDLNGEMIHAGKVDQSDGYIDLKSIKSGFFFVKFKFGSKEIIKKIIINK